MLASSSKVLYFDCFSGLSGDMIVASLLDAGVDEGQFRAALSTLDLPDYEIRVGSVQRCSLSATSFEVRTTGDHCHRSLSTIISLINDSGLSDRVKKRAGSVFQRLGEVEAAVHGCDIESIHFHEVGAVDSIVDIVGSCVCMELLGVDEVFFPAVPVGSGTVKMAHGVLPVPAPATARLLEGFEIYGGGDGEMTTPTGAAIVTTLGTQVLQLPRLTTQGIGYGAGSREVEGRPNVLRAMVGVSSSQSAAEGDTVCLLSCQLDDMTGEEHGFLAEQLWSGGALDVVFIPIYMKKGRPGVKIEVISGIDAADRLADVLLRRSSTFGLRRSMIGRQKLGRRSVTVSLANGEVGVKLGILDGKVVKVAPEYEDCRRAALAGGLDLRTVYRQAEQAAWRMIET